MIVRPWFGRLRPLVGFLAALALFLSLGALLLVAQQRRALVVESDKHLSHQLGLFESIITDDLLRFDYGGVRQHATEFGGRSRDIVRIRVEGPDGAALALYQRREPSSAVSGHRHTFAYAPGKNVTVSLDYDLVPMRERLRTLIVRVALATVLFTAVAGSLLWHLLGRIAFSPLKRAVADLNLANERLEQRVTERTRDILAASAALEREIADRQAAETAIKKMLVWVQEEKNKSDAIIAAIGDGISIMDRDFRILYQNEEHKRLLGTSAGEYCYRSMYGREQCCEGCPVSLSFADGGIHVCERSGVSRHGPVHVEITASALRDAAGNITAGIEVVRDVTERARVHQELQDSYEFQQNINAILGMPLAGRSPEEIIQEALTLILSSSRYASHPSGGIFLFDEGSGDLALFAQQGLPPEVRASCARVPPGACLCGRAAETREVQFCSTVDERHERGSGRMPPHGRYCVPIVMADRVLGVLVVYLASGRSRDAKEESFLVAAMNALAWIVHRKRLETEQEWMIKDLRTLLDTVSAARKEWQETFDSITDMISIHDKGRTVIRANMAFARHFGREPKEIWGLRLNELDPGGRDPLLADLLADEPQQGRSDSREVSDPATGKIFHIFTFPLSSDDASSGRVIHIIREITDEREREMRLIMSERLASLGQMAAGIAHEINNPLASIAGCADGMSRRISRNQFEPELFARYLAIIRDELERSKRITTSMLSIVRKDSFEKRTVSIHQVIASSLEIIGYQGRLKRVSVTRSFAPGTPVVLGSEGELKQVLLIVLTNALDAMEEGGPLTVATAAAGGTLTIDVTDSGTGIPAELTARIFDPFFTTKGGKGGTGLGLSIARRIVSAHRGAIQSLPAARLGTTIRITLPLETAQAADSVPDPAPPA